MIAVRKLASLNPLVRPLLGSANLGIAARLPLCCHCKCLIIRKNASLSPQPDAQPRAVSCFLGMAVRKATVA